MREGTAGRGEGGGGLVTEIENLDPVRGVVVKYFRVIPWFIRLSFHSLSFSFQELGSKGVVVGRDGGRWGVGEGGGRGYVLSGLDGWRRGGEVERGWNYGEWLEGVNETQRERRREEVGEVKRNWREEKKLRREKMKEEKLRKKRGEEEVEKEELNDEQEEDKFQQQQQQQQQQQKQQKQQQYHLQQRHHNPPPHNNRTSGDLLWIKITPGKDRQNPHLLEYIVSLPPSSSLSVSLEYDLSLLYFFEYPPDAHRGVDVGSGSVKYHFICNPFEFSVLDGLSKLRKEELLFWRDYQIWKGWFYFDI